MKRKIFLLIVMSICCFCKKSNFSSRDEKDDPFYLEADQGCLIKNQKDKNCLNEKENLVCSKTFENLKQSRLDRIFFNKVWMSEDQQTFFFHVDAKGKIKIFEGGPDKNQQQRKIVGEGRIFSENKMWFYEQKCESNICDTFRIPITYIGCSITTNLIEKEVLMYLEFGNRKFIDSQEIERDTRYKLISFTEQTPVQNQLFNGFISTKVQPIPTKETK